MSLRDRQRMIMEQGSKNITKWIGSTQSVSLHTILFLVCFGLPALGIMPFERMLLFLTTIVSLEAIYLSIFIQMSLNMSHENIEIMQEDIVEIQKDVDEIGEGIDEIGEGIDEILDDEDDEEIVETEEEIVASIKVLQRKLAFKRRK